VNFFEIYHSKHETVENITVWLIEGQGHWSSSQGQIHWTLRHWKDLING